MNLLFYNINSTSCWFDDVINVLNKNMKHARAIEFML